MLLLLTCISRFLDPNPAPGSTAPAAAPAPPAVPPTRPAETRADDLTTRMIAQYGSNEQAMRALALRAITAEDAQGTAERALAEARSRTPEGSVVLTKEQAGALDKLRPYGTLDEIEKKLKRHGELETEVAVNAAKANARRAAPLAGLDADALEAYAIDKKLPLEFRPASVKVNGKTVQQEMPFVRKPGDDKAPWQSLAEYVATLPAFEQRALRVTAATPQAASVLGTPSVPAAPASTHLEFPRSAPTPANANTGDPAGDFIRNRDAARAKIPNPLFPQPTAQ